MARTDPVDDDAVLTCAKRLVLNGTYPTALAVRKAMGYRWCESVIAGALARLRSCGRLVCTLPRTRGDSGRRPEPTYDYREIATLARDVRYQGIEGTRDVPPPPSSRKPAWASLESYWVPGRRAWYRREQA